MVRIGSLVFEEFPLLLAPMEDVSDPPFRSVCKMLGADLMFTEFISSEGLIRNAIKSRKKLDIYPEERPIGIQIFGGDEEAMSMAAAIVEAVQPDLVDINFGCPVKKVVCKGAGAAVLKDIRLMERLTRSVVKSTHLPVTVKTRLGWDENSINILDVVMMLQDCGVKAVTIHARTRSQLYKGKADWEWMAKVKNLPGLTIPVFGNGDIDTPQKAIEYQKKYGVDGIMIGRAAIGNPWIFQQIKHLRKTGTLLPPPTLKERARVCLMHLENSLAWKGERVGLIEMRMHYARYFKNIPHIREARNRLVTSDSLQEVKEILTEMMHKPEYEEMQSSYAGNF